MWTRAYRPFITGGDVHSPIATDIKAGGPVSIGKGFKAFLAASPKGTPLVIESKSGGIIGHDLATVRNDVATAKLSVMRKQVREESDFGKRADILTNDKFFSMYPS